MTTPKPKTHPLVAALAACAGFGLFVGVFGAAIGAGATSPAPLPGHAATNPSPAPSSTAKSAPAPSGVACEAISVPSDPRAAYCIHAFTFTLAGDATVTTRRIGPSGESWSVREIRCLTGQWRYVGDGDTLAAAKRRNPMRWSQANPGTIADEVKRETCFRVGHALLKESAR